MELFAGYEREGFNINNVWHKFTLQYMFMSRIQYELNEFKESWNNHPMKTGHNYTPLQLILLRNDAIDYDAPFNLENDGEDGKVDVDVDDDNINPQVELYPIICPLTNINLHAFKQLISPLRGDTLVHELTNIFQSALTIVLDYRDIQH
jgi:hypothetical protein